MAPALVTLPHERRVQRYALLALAASAALAAAQTGLGDGRVLGVEVPALAPVGVALLGALVGAVAVLRRSPATALVGAGVMLVGLGLAVTPATPLAWGLALAFALFTLAWVELVHVTQRYERAHRVVEQEHVPEASLNRVTDETLKTLGARAGLSGLAVALAIGLAYALRYAGPRQWREAVETTSPLGVALVALALLGGLSVFILLSGATFRRDAAPPAPTLAEVETDVAE
jgi:hypothetical protein